MATRSSVREQLKMAKGKLKQFEGRLREVEGRLKTLRSQAERAGGEARVRFTRAERQVRQTIDATLKNVDVAVKALEPRARKALEQTRLVARGVQAGIRAGSATYREKRRKG
jgi:hypothetical protein